MNATTLLPRVIEVLAREFPLIEGAGLAPDLPLLSSGLLDSFGIITLVDALENALGLTIDVERVDPTAFETPRQIAEICADALQTASG
ncbi:MAG: hypothetical protein KC620_14850 [Myxococcales bacterium]|nr:hypothetical protein [Myxococcales bacterium]